LSVSLTQQLDSLPSLISDLKKTSRNNNIPVLLGGPVFFSCDVSAMSLGADGISKDALEGIQLASLLVSA